VRVLKIGSGDMMRRQNVELEEADLDLIVGIPAPIRRKMGIQDIDYVVCIGRDSIFLFKKFFPQQLLTLSMLLLTLVTMFGTLTESKMMILIIVITFFIALPFLILTLFSEQRIRVDQESEKQRTVRTKAASNQYPKSD
jgi:hypothetical protein